MCSDVVIRVEYASKCYQIYGKPQDRLKQALWRGSRRYYREFWALKNVSLEIRKGEVVGIIGRNGAGKSTLLQMICGTLNPTEGRIEVNGRVAALLELGAGFNPEFSGRENVYLNASILGMTRGEIDARYDSILEFADIGEFISQPVKTYSSGMFVRLAFAVAIHVQPDVLIVDEALSVGDIAFRNKCLARIQGMMAEGVTVLFVTHDTSTLQLLCNRVVWLDHGELKASGDPVRISQDYYAVLTGQSHGFESAPDSLVVQQDTGKAKFTKVSLKSGINGLHAVGEMLKIHFELTAQESLGAIIFAVSIYRSDGDWLIGQTSLDEGVIWREVPEAHVCRGTLQLYPLCLAPGDYLVALGAYSDDYALCYALTDLGCNFSVRSRLPTWGKFIHPCKWKIEDAD